MPLQGHPVVPLLPHNELGFKQVKWVQAVEFVATFRELGSGEGGSTKTTSISAAEPLFDHPIHYRPSSHHVSQFLTMVESKRSAAR
jgi:hypothetical protein